MQTLSHCPVLNPSLRSYFRCPAQHCYLFPGLDRCRLRLIVRQAFRQHLHCRHCVPVLDIQWEASRELLPARTFQKAEHHFGPLNFTLLKKILVQVWRSLTRISSGKPVFLESHHAVVPVTDNVCRFSGTSHRRTKKASLTCIAPRWTSVNPMFTKRELVLGKWQQGGRICQRRSGKSV